MTLSRTFTITHDRRRPGNVAPTWDVTGPCEEQPLPFDTLDSARLFVEWEIQKYQNGRLLPFVPTHAILWQNWRVATPRRIIPVRIIEAKEERAVSVPIALYTIDEWVPCVLPEWTYSKVIDRVFLDGVMMTVAWFLLPYRQAVGALGFIHAVERRDKVLFEEAP